MTIWETVQSKGASCKNKALLRRSEIKEEDVDNNIVMNLRCKKCLYWWSRA